MAFKCLHQNNLENAQKILFDIFETMKKLKSMKIKNKDLKKVQLDYMNNKKIEFFELIILNENYFNKNFITSIKKNRLKTIKFVFKYIELTNYLMKIRDILKVSIIVSKIQSFNPYIYIKNILSETFTIKNLPKQADEYKLIKDYVFASKKSLVIKNIFSVNRINENIKNFDNKMLLMHETEALNVLGILISGLKNSHLFDKLSETIYGFGVSFSDKFGAVCNSYAKKIKKNKNYIKKNFIFICEVGLGNIYKSSTKKKINLKDVYQTHHIVGSQIPDQTKQFVFNDGLILPCGPLVKNKNEKLILNSEFIVDDINIKIRYLVQLE